MSIAVCPTCERRHGVPVVAGSGEGSLVLRCGFCDSTFAADRDDASSPNCAQHTTRRATRVCETCDARWCAECVAPAEHEGRAERSPCHFAAVYPIAEAVERPALWDDWRAILTYPLAPKGLMIFGILWVLSLIPVVSFFIWLLCAAYGMHILRETARGLRHLPEFPDFDGLFESMVWPTLRLLGVTMIAFAPALAAVVGLGLSFTHPVTLLLLLLGAFVEPFWVARIAAHERFWQAITPRSTVILIGSILPEYLSVWAFIFAFALLRFLLELAIGSIPFTGAILGALSIWAFAVEFHLLGRMVARTRDRVDWGL